MSLVEVEAIRLKVHVVTKVCVRAQDVPGVKVVQVNHILFQLGTNITRSFQVAVT